MDFLVAPFAGNAFMLNALVAGLLVSVACGVVGSFVVLRGLAFIGDALGHGVLPGVAIAVLLGFPGMLGAAGGALLMILGITAITRKSSLSSDTAIGLLFVAMLALGVVIVSRSRSFSGDLVRILFGEILGISPGEILVQLGATLAILLLALICYRPFLLLCFGPEQADASGFPSRFYHGLMLGMIALTVVVSFKTVGTLLVFGMLLAPAASAALYARRVGAMIAGASLIGAVSVYAGLLASYWLDLAAGASITLTASLIFFVAFAARRLGEDRARRRRLAAVPAAGEAHHG
jgi:ABC-type Mn2+/Zn2+ transport system permease subunit